MSVAEELICSGTFDRVTVAGIVKLAGTSVGAFYARFSDKEALRHVLQERFVWRAEAAVNEVTELLLLERKYEISHPRPELAIQVGLSMVIWTLREASRFRCAGSGTGRCCR